MAEMLREADAYDTFNRHMSKIQDAIIAIEKLEMEHPVNSQAFALEVAAEDLTKLSKTYRAKRTAAQKR